MQAPTVTPIPFDDITDLPEVHSDARRTIYERIVQTNNGVRRTSRSVVNADEAVIGNHYHDFNQTFTGRGEGTLYTASKDDPTQVLSADGWAFTIPEGIVMALRLKKGAIQIFESDKDYRDGANTHRVVIAS
jgi:quercetin dioxygenase-like cupin family protein